MGKGFNNFMSKKDFHPSAIWNLKKVWMAEQKLDEDKKKQDEMRALYEKEQEQINNKALLGDEKARLGLAFMYDAPPGLKKEEKEQNPEELPKFEWQRKYNAPRESWAKGDQAVQDQPFGIQVRNIRCVKCHTWGHMNTDRECPLYNMSGNHEAAGYSTNPSDLIKDLRKAEELESNRQGSSKKERLECRTLNENMKSEYGLQLKRGVINSVQTDEALARIGRQEETNEKHVGQESPAKSIKRKRSSEIMSEEDLMNEFLKTLSDKEKAKIFQKFFALQNGDGRSKKKSHKKRRDRDHNKSKEKVEDRHRKSSKETARRHRRSVSSSGSSFEVCQKRNSSSGKRKYKDTSDSEDFSRREKDTNSSKRRKRSCDSDDSSKNERRYDNGKNPKKHSRDFSPERMKHSSDKHYSSTSDKRRK